MSRPRSRRALAAAAVVLFALAGCGTDDEERTTGDGSGGDAPALEEIRATVSLADVVGPGARVLGVAGGSTSARVTVLLAPADGGAPVLARVADGAETTTTELPGLDGGGPAAVLPAAVGRVIVVGFSGGRLAGNPVAEDGDMVTVPLQADLTPATVSAMLATVSVYGDYVHLVVTDPAGASRVLTASPYTGEVLAEAPLTYEGAARIVPRDVAADLHGTSVVVAADVETAAGTRAVLFRFGDGLQPADSAPLELGDAPATVESLHVVDDEDLILLAVLATGGEPATGVTVLSIEPGEPVRPLTSAEVPPAPGGAQIVIEDSWVYLAGLTDGDTPQALTVTPVAVDSGEVAPALQLCADGSVAGTHDLLVVGTCADSGSAEPTVWVLEYSA